MGKQLATTTDPAPLLPPVEEVAQAIVQISEGMKKLTASTAAQTGHPDSVA